MRNKKSYKKLLKIKERSKYQDYGWSDLEDDLEELEKLFLNDLVHDEKETNISIFRRIMLNIAGFLFDLSNAISNRWGLEKGEY